MKLNKIFSPTGRLATLFAAFASIAMLSSCDSWLYEDEGDCDPHYKVKFRFDYNMKKADAFSQEVNAVTLYIVDPESGRVVWRKTENSDILKSEDYLMDVEGLAPGNYKLMAWAGDGHKDSPHFNLEDSGDDHTMFTCTMARETNVDGLPESSANLHRLYKDLPQEFNNREFVDDQGTHIHTVRLMKNTNDITVVLQQLSGETVDPDAFDYVITDTNGKLNYDNSLMDDDEITYRPWRTRPGIAAGYVPENMAEAQFSAAIANFSVNRMMADHKMVLTITRKSDGGIVAKVPVIDYALMVKANYDDMPDQEYLDRQDNFSMVFFLDEGMRWINTEIYINSWKVVLNDINI
ncbi:MAG: FimB/Mfa2 family fimbrial subunit [Clostridium sp.]|nr:FimB/Mfa2 family fimbrial subunit [Clostridium sp.]